MYRWRCRLRYDRFVIAVWVPPQMSVGHLFFAIFTTADIFKGILLEQRDLVAYLGLRQRHYRATVGMLFHRPGAGSHRQETHVK